MSDYHYLVASLPEITFDGSKINYSIERFREEVCNRLSSSDAKKINLFFYAWDNKNLLELLRYGYDADIPLTGYFSREKLVDLIISAKSGDPCPAGYPTYMYNFLIKYLHFNIFVIKYLLYTRLIKSGLIFQKE